MLCTAGLNGICRVKGCYGSWIMYVDCVVFPVLYGECVELGSIKCGGFKVWGVLGQEFGLFHEEGVVWSVGVGVLYLGESKKEW